MGGYYVCVEGLLDVVVDVICDYYKLVGQGDDVFIVLVMVVVSLVDKLDMIEEFFSVEMLLMGLCDLFVLCCVVFGVIVLINKNGF